VRKGQASLEYLMVVGFALMLLLPVTYLLLDSLQAYSQERSASQAFAALTELKNAAERAYEHGPPTMIVTTLSLPDGIVNFSLRRNIASSGCTACTELVFIMRDMKEVFVTTNVNMSAMPSAVAGGNGLPLSVEADSRFYGAGLRKIAAEAHDGEVTLSLP